MIACKNNRKYTKKKNQLEYESLYMGPEFMIEFRYAQIMNIKRQFNLISEERKKSEVNAQTTLGAKTLQA